MDRAEHFSKFYEAVHGYPPFPWQTRLAQMVAEGEWPETLSLPTSSGKTSVLDVAVHALAMDKEDFFGGRRAPMRIFFVIDRRLVVDEVSAHAEKIRAALESQGNKGVLEEVRNGLLRHGGRSPLKVTTLRGGMYRDESWTDLPNQPLLCVTTIDQIGSRLLFRGYGISRYQYSVQAGLVGNDSLFIVDEAHLAQPFLETLRRVGNYRNWADTPLSLPFKVTFMTATPRGNKGVFRLNKDDRQQKLLGLRIRVSKPTELVEMGKSPDQEAVKYVQKLRDAGRKRIGVILNRVDSARKLYKKLRANKKLEVHLLTGRIRPIDREWVEKTALDLVGVGRPDPEKPAVIVATQTLEVGANLDFDALVTECASLPSLRQRFGRLDRLGLRDGCPGFVLHKPRTKKNKISPDPIYGTSDELTFKFLKEVAEEEMVNFGTEAMDSLVEDMAEKDLALLAGQVKSAPMLFPDHLGLLTQTDPVPHPDPEISVWLHGVQEYRPEIQVIWRADLPENQKLWAETVALSPPRTQEALTLPLWVFRGWVRGDSRLPGFSDLEGRSEIGKEQPCEKKVLQWRGVEESEIVDPSNLKSGDTVVIPSDWGGCDEYGWCPDSKDSVRDLGEEANLRYQATLPPTKRQLQMRLHPDLITEDFSEEEFQKALKELLELSLDPEREEDCRESYLQLLDTLNLDPEVQWLQKADWVAYPSRDALFVYSGTAAMETDSDDTASLTVPVELEKHLEGVGAWAERLAFNCGIGQLLVSDLRLAGELHDLGKAEPRFQAMLHGGSEIKAAASGKLLAKSGMTSTNPAKFRKAHRDSGLPHGFRHEFVSVSIIQESSGLLEAANDPDLVLHLVGSHHGRGRPFAPVVMDPEPRTVAFNYQGRTLSGRSDHGLERLDSGWAERFERLTQRYGWWGLAGLEAVLRLADRNRSRQEQGI